MILSSGNSGQQMQRLCSHFIENYIIDTVQSWVLNLILFDSLVIFASFRRFYFDKFLFILTFDFGFLC